MAERLSYHWFFKYKIYHLLFWFVYHYLWWSLYTGSLWQVAQDITVLPYGIKFSFYVIFQAIGVYFNLYFLIPHYLERRQYATYLSLLMVTIISTASVIVLGYYLGGSFSEKSVAELFKMESASFWSLFKYNTLSSTMASMALAMSITLSKNWIESKRKQEMLEKEKLETELKFLKSQFNPHFLFNTINSIFVLIHKNPDMASESLAKFSNLLRYQLYECNEQQIPLSLELSYLENFIELEKLRQDTQVEINTQIAPLGSPNLTIAPFILMPFLENAFKHVSQSKSSQNWIDIQLHIEENTLIFSVSNSIAKGQSAANTLIDYGGIGLKNVKRRLELLYPGQYELSIQKEGGAFGVKLELGLRQEAGVEALVMT